MEVITIKQDNALKRPSQILKHGYVCSVFVRLSERLRQRSGAVSASHLVESEELMIVSISCCICLCMVMFPVYPEPYFVSPKLADHYCSVSAYRSPTVLPWGKPGGQQPKL